MAFEKTYQYAANVAADTSSTTTAWKSLTWSIAALLTGYTSAVYNDATNAQSATIQGLWTHYASSDASTAGIDSTNRWLGTKGSAVAGNTGTAASIVTGATITGAVRLSGLTGTYASTDVGKVITISGAATSANNGTFVIVQQNSATSVDVFNPNAVTGDANNGAITAAEFGRYSYTAANFTGATGGTNHSWIVLKSPLIAGNNWYFYIDLNSATIGKVSCLFSKTAPTGGSTTARPTSVDEVSLTNWGIQSIFNTANANGRYNAALTTDGNFHWLGSNDASGVFFSAIIFQILQDRKSADLYPACMYFGAGGSNILNRTGLTNASGNVGMHGALSVNGPTNLTPSAATIVPSGGTAHFFANMTTTDFADSSYDDLPIYWYVNTAGQKSIRGRWYDYRWAPEGAAQGLAEPTSTPEASMVAGFVWVPTCAVPSL